MFDTITLAVDVARLLTAAVNVETRPRTSGSISKQGCGLKQAPHQAQAQAPIKVDLTDIEEDKTDRASTPPTPPSLALLPKAK